MIFGGYPTEEKNDEMVGVEPSDFKVNITEEVNSSEKDWEGKTIASIYCSEDVSNVEIFLTGTGMNQTIIGGGPVYKDITAGKTINITCGDFYSAIIKNIGKNLDVVVKYNNAEIARKSIKITRIVTPEDFIVQFFNDDNQYNGNVIMAMLPVSGNLTVYVNDEETPRYNKHQEGSGGFGGTLVNKADLGLTASGDYNISAKYITDDYGTFDLGKDSFLIGEEYIKSIEGKINLRSAESEVDPIMLTGIVVIKDPENVTGTVTVTIDGKEVYKKSIHDNKTALYIKSSELDYTGERYGNHAVKVIYNKNDAEEHSLERTSLIYESPIIYYPAFMFEGENESYIVTANKKYTGTVTVYKSDYGTDSEELVEIGSAELINGIARISLENLPSGNNMLAINISIDQVPINQYGFTYATVLVQDNSAGYESNISATTIPLGESVTVNLKGNVSAENVYLFVDGVAYKDITINGDVATSTISDLTPGEHHITIKRYYVYPYGGEDDETYSNTFVVNVVEPADPNLTVRVNNTYKGKGVVVEILANENFTGEVSVKLNSSDSTYTINVADGYGSKDIGKLATGSYLATATFEGNDYFNPDEDSTTFNVEDFIITIAEQIDLDDENIENIPFVTVYCPNGADGDDIYFEIITEDLPYAIDFLKTSLKENLGKTVNLTIKDSSQGLTQLGCGTFIIRASIDWGPVIGTGSINITRVITNDNFAFVVNEESEYGAVIHLQSSPVNGNVTVLVNGTERYNQYVEKYNGKQINANDLGIDNPGEYGISFKFVSEDGKTYDLADFTYFQCSEHIVIYNIDTYSKITPIVKIIDSPINGNVSIILNGKTLYNKHLNLYSIPEIYISDIDLDNLTYGTHKLVVNYTKDNGESYALERTVLVYETPNCIVPHLVVEGEKSVFIITALKEYTGKVNITQIKGTETVLFTADIVNGSAIIPIENLAKGKYKLKYTCAIDQVPNKILGRGFDLTVKEKMDLFRVEINATEIQFGDSVNATFYSDVEGITGLIDTYINGKLYNRTELKTEGKVDMIFDDLAVGDNYINFEFHSPNDEYYYATTILVKVSPIIKVDPDLTIRVNNTCVGNDAVVEILAKETFNGTVKVTLNNSAKIYTVDVTNGYGTKAIDMLSAGSYLATATFEGNRFFNESENSTTFTVEAFIVTVTDEIIDLDDETSKDKTLVSIYCPESANQTIRIYIRPYYENTDLDSAYIQINEEYAGKTINITCKDFTYVLRGVSSGKHQIIVIYGDGWYHQEIGRGTVNTTRDKITEENFIFRTYDEYGTWGYVVDVLTVPIKGNITVSVDGIERFNQYINKYGPRCSITQDALNITEGGEHAISFKFIAGNGTVYNLADFKYFAKSKYIFIDPYMNTNPAELGETFIHISGTNEDHLIGTATITFDGKIVYHDEYDGGFVGVNINYKSLNITDVTYGTHDIFVNYTKPNGETDTLQRTIVAYKFYEPMIMYEGENEAIIFNTNKDYTGKFNLTSYGKDGEKLLFSGNLVYGYAEIPIELAKGQYNLLFTCVLDQFSNKPISRNFNLMVTENYEGCEANITPQAVREGNPVEISFNSDVEGEIMILVDHEICDINMSSTSYHKFINNLSAGKHSITVKFMGRNAYYSKTVIVSVKSENPIDPDLSISVSNITEGENALVEITTNNTFSGNVLVQIAGNNYTVAVKYGYGNITISDLSVGNYTAVAIFEEDEIFKPSQKTAEFSVNVKPKVDPNLKITVTSVRQSDRAVITITTDASFTGKVNVKIGSKNYVVNVVNGKGTAKVASMKVGTYKATATFAETDKFKASTKTATFKVKADTIKLTLKKVKVKKSAKKLKITATLKINGKKVKGKTLKFKFNKKSYKAKTNKKGVAKITIKKNVLKKLKVGKKVKYQVSYGKKTVKRTVKVRR